MQVLFLSCVCGFWRFVPTGLVCPLDASHSSAQLQFVLVNGRCVRAPELTSFVHRVYAVAQRALHADACRIVSAAVVGPAHPSSSSLSSSSVEPLAADNDDERSLATNHAASNSRAKR